MGRGKIEVTRTHGGEITSGRRNLRVRSNTTRTIRLRLRHDSL